MAEINERTAKKIGEVLAFAKCGLDTFERGKKALQEISKDGYDNYIEDSNKFIKKISDIADEYEVGEMIDRKADKTLEKLKTMRDLYIGDEWDNPVEILEWHGFFFGAGMVHWALVESSARQSDINNLTTLAEEGVAFYHEQLMTTVSELKLLGRKL